MEENKKIERLRRFGRYLILDHLVDGGMAQICRARYLGEQADKIVAIKMIRPQYSENPAFKKMFMDEIKVTFGLIHPNIAQTYDYGIIDGQLYTAMEYIDGKNLKQFLDRLKQQKYIFPIEISLYIISQVCQALTYAHSFTDKLNGKSLNIIHRDISPHNIMLTYDGSIKVIDFGIAKATTNTEETQAGTIKGKLSYLAPEYLEGVQLDHRYDQFAIGITLWEMLCGRKLFQANNELAILKKIQSCKIPAPSTINNKVSPELDAIVLKSLSKIRDNRFENTEQFNRALVKFLYGKYPDFNSADLNHFSKELFKEEIKNDRERFHEYGKIDISSFLEDIKREQSQASSSSQNQAPPSPTQSPSSGDLNKDSIELGRRIPYIDIEVEENNNNIKSTVSKIKPDVDRYKRADNSLRTVPRSVTSIPGKPPGSISTNFIDKRKFDKELEKEQKHKVKRVVNLVLAIIVVPAICFALYYVLNEKLINHNTKKNTHVARGTNNSSDANDKAKVLITNANPYQIFFINNKRVNPVDQQLTIPYYTNINLRVEQQNRKPIFVNLQLEKESSKVIKLPNAGNGTFGLLDASSKIFSRSVLSFYIDGNPIQLDLPISTKQLPIGKYEATLVNNHTNIEKVITFTIKENTVTNLSDLL